MKKALLLLALASSCLSAQTDQIVKVDRPSTAEDANLNAMSQNLQVVDERASVKAVENLEAQKQAEAKIKVEELIKTLAHGDVNSLAYFSSPLLYWVAIGGLCKEDIRNHCIQELIEAGADVNAECAFGFTSLDGAEMHGYGDSMELLKQYGAQYSHSLTVTPERIIKAVPYFLAGALTVYLITPSQINTALLVYCILQVLAVVGLYSHWIKYFNFFAAELGAILSFFYHGWRAYRNAVLAQQLLAAAIQAANNQIAHLIVAAAPQVVHHAAPLLAGAAAFVHRRDVLPHNLAARGA